MMDWCRTEGIYMSTDQSLHGLQISILFGYDAKQCATENLVLACGIPAGRELDATAASYEGGHNELQIPVLSA